MLKINSDFLRFLLVGLLNTIVGLSSIFLLFNLIHLNYWWATFLGNCIGATCSYLLNRTFTFRSKNKLYSSEILKFIAITVVCYFLSYSLALYFANLIFGLFIGNRVWINNLSVLLGAGLYTITNYIGHKFLTFRVSRSGEV